MSFFEADPEGEDDTTLRKSLLGVEVKKEEDVLDPGGNEDDDDDGEDEVQ